VQTWRSCIPGGWLILVINYTPDKSTRITFYSDAVHGWNGYSLPVAQSESDLADADILGAESPGEESGENARFWALQRFEDKEP
jgi:hypothetical protein